MEYLNRGRKPLLCTSIILILFCLIPLANAYEEPNWSEGAIVPKTGRANIYSLNPDSFQQYIDRGKIHAQIYPVEVTGLLPPYYPLLHFLESKDDGFIKRNLKKMFSGFLGIHNMDQLLKWVGLQEYPKESDRGVYSVPFPNGVRPQERIGLGLIETPRGTGFTISCAACHASNLFGKTVLGLTNRFPQANLTFLYAHTFITKIPSKLFQIETKATDGERAMFKKAQKNLRSIGVKKPAVIGLDTSLAQVALSLARRNDDAYATKNRKLEKNPREEILQDKVADSKPAVWWNVKYKNRWLSDGSVVSGNPILTNILWNEIGRGADLKQLEDWLNENNKKIMELTSAIFSSEAPRYTDFFSPSSINILRAQSGEKTFLQRCAGCHGTYEKAWSLPNAESLSHKQLLETVRVNYHSKTPVINVGTDPSRFEGMKSLEQLNNLAISRNNGIQIKAQHGYVPPPLVGIWARWPYFHNNSIPNLCALLTRSEKRPKKFYMGEANNPQTDFDSACNGYPLGKATPKEWKKSKKFLFQTRKEGLGNMGHDEGIFLKNGNEILSPQEKLDLIQFLQTL